MRIRLLLTSIFFALLLPCALLSQGGLLVRNIEVQQFPLLHADLYAFDAEGNLLKSITPGDIIITEDSAVSRNITNLSCAPSDEAMPLSSVLVMDISTAMADSAMMNIAKSAAGAWIDVMAADSSEAAVAGFNHLNYIYQDLTQDKARLLKAIGQLQPGGGKDYDAAFLKAPAGGIEIVARGTHKRILVLITNGGDGGSESAILQAAQQNDITVFVMGVKFALPEALKSIAEQTGGMWFEKIQDELDAIVTARQIYSLTRGGKPCKITWESEANCFKNRTAQIEIPSISAFKTFEYSAPISRTSRLVVSPAGIELGGITPDSFKDTIITITAENGDIRVSDITSSDTTFSIQTLPKDFLLKNGESKQIAIRFQPVDSVQAFATISFKTDACTTETGYIRGGFVEKTSARLLKVVSPNGGEILAAGGKHVVEWTGVLPQDTVRIEYSADAGDSWQLVTDEATGLRYVWNIPDTVSSAVLVRIQQKNGPANSWRSITKIGFKSSLDRFRAIISPDGSRVLTLLNETAEVWDATTGKRLLLLPNEQRISAIAYSRSGKYIATAFKDTAAYTIYDAVSGELYRASGTSKTGTYFVSINIHPQDSSIILAESNGGIYVQSIFIPEAPFKIIPGIFFTPVYSVRYSGDGTRFAVTEEDSIAVYSIDNNLLNNVELVAKIYQSQLDIYDYGAGINFNGDRVIASVKDGNNQVNTVMWDVNTQQRIRTFTMPRQNGYARSSHLSRDNTLLLVGEAISNHVNNAYIFDVESAQIIATLSKHTNLVDDGSFSADKQRIVTISSRDGSVIIWEKSPEPDSSNSYFSISGPLVTIQNIDLGKVVVNVAKDSVISEFLCNSTSTPLRVDSLRLTGNSEFSVLKSDNFAIEPNSCYPLTFGFKTSIAGVFTDTIMIFTPYGISKSVIRGEGVRTDIETARLIDFGRIFKGNTKDTVIEFSLINRSSTAITVSETSISGPDTTQFSIISGGGAFTLAPNASRTMELRFSPDSVGRVSSAVSFVFKTENAANQWPQPVIQLFGEGICLGGDSPAQIRFAENSISAKTGQLIKIPLKVIPPQNSLQNVPRGFTCEIRFNKSVLFPVSPTPYGNIDGNDRVIRISGRRENSSDVLAELAFTAALGDTGNIFLKIENFQWENCGGSAETFATEIIIENIAETDGIKRFFKDTDLPGIIILENPFGEMVEVRYRLIEPGKTEIFLMDIIGRKVAVLLSENAAPGFFIQNFSTYNLAAGTYFLVMQTPTQSITQRIEKMR